MKQELLRIDKEKLITPLKYFETNVFFFDFKFKISL